MPPTKKSRKRKPKSFSLFKLKPKTKVRLIRLSVIMNIALIFFMVFAIKRDGLALTFQHTTHFLSAPLASVKWPSLKLPSPKKETLSKPVKKQVLPPTPAPVKVTPPPKKIAAPVIQPPPPVARSLSVNKPKITFVIDDMGHTLTDRDILRELGRDVTYAILPHLTYSRFFGLLSKETGAEVILHQPFEAKNGTIPGPGLITDRMSTEQSLNVLRHSLSSVPHHQGINNHMGSQGTSNPELMLPILKELKQRRLFFLDSVTSSKSVGFSLARQIGLPSVKRDIFLDNVDETEAIRAQVRKTAAVARKNGYAIAIGHYHPKTLRVLREEIRKLKSEGFELVSLGEIIRELQAKNVF